MILRSNQSLVGIRGQIEIKRVNWNIMNFDLLHPRDQIERNMALIYGRDMTATPGGNISVRDEDGPIWISPARVDKVGTDGINQESFGYFC